MPDIQINQFNQSIPEDNDILHGKKGSGEDVKFQYGVIAEEILSRIPEQLDYTDFSAVDKFAPNDRFKFQREDNYLSISGDNLVKTILNAVYPIGSVYTNYDRTVNPSTLLGIGTWTQIRGRFLVGEGTGTDVNNVSVNFATTSTGGEYVHTLSTSEMPGHTHALFGIADDGDPSSVGVGEVAAVAATNYSNTESYRIIESNGGNPTFARSSIAGSGNAHNNIPPYQTVFIWRRVA